MTLSLYSTYKTWRREVEAGRLEAAARRVIAPSNAGGRRARPTNIGGVGEAAIGIS